MELRCPDCASPEVALIDRRTVLECGNCGSFFSREEAFVTVADAEEATYCTCDELRGCPQRFARAEALVGAVIHDSYGRRWQVLEVGEKEGFPTICSESYWDRPDEVTVLRPAAERPDPPPPITDSNLEGGN